MHDAPMIPHDLEAEQSTLGALLIDRDAIVAVAPWLRSEHFYLEKHGLVYDAVLRCYNRRTPPDIRTVADALGSQLDSIGGYPFLVSLSLTTPTAVHIEYYARTVERTATLRRLIQVGGRIAALGYNIDGDLDETLTRAQALLMEASRRTVKGGFTGLDDALQVYADEWAVMQRGEMALGLATGLSDFDDLTGGLKGGDMLTLAARPGMGKTALGLQIAYNVGKAGGRVGIFSFEMSTQQLVARLVGIQSGYSVSAQQVVMDDDDQEAMIDSFGKLSSAPILIDDTASLTIGELRLRANQQHAQTPFDLLIIDYLQLMKLPKMGDRVNGVTEISQGIKALARELNVPVIALAQLNRELEKRPSKVPMLSDLRDSGSIEQDSDLVLFIYRDEVYHPESDKKGTAEIHVAKHRNGPLGVVAVNCDLTCGRWRNLARYTPVPGYGDERRAA